MPESSTCLSASKPLREGEVCHQYRDSGSNATPWEGARGSDRNQYPVVQQPSEPQGKCIEWTTAKIVGRSAQEYDSAGKHLAPLVMHCFFSVDSLINV